MLQEINDVYSIADYENVRKLAHKVKENNYQAIRLAAVLMSLSVEKEGCIFIPVPSHTGIATYTLRLANLIAKKTNGTVLNVLSSIPRETSYAQKIGGIKPSQIQLSIVANIPSEIIDELNGKKIYLVDNVVDSANTFKQCQMAVQEKTGIVPDILTIGSVSNPSELVLQTTNHNFDFQDKRISDDFEFYRKWLRNYRKRQRRKI